MHKSIRASDDNAALYWLARMLEGGEDPLYIARRLVVCASEDIGQFTRRQEPSFIYFNFSISNILITRTFGLNFI